MYRQGDVLLKQVTELPEGTRNINTTTIALGEATGHHHTFRNGQVQVLEANAILFAVVAEPSQLTHQEHDTITVPPGTYEVVRQREYTPQETMSSSSLQYITLKASRQLV